MKDMGFGYFKLLYQFLKSFSVVAFALAAPVEPLEK